MRIPFNNRPWIAGKLYDTLARTSILHCDAQVIDAGALKYLLIDWRQGGRKQVALDAYMIEDDGLTPIWDASMATRHALRFMNTGDAGVPWAALHACVTEQARKASGGKWARVSLLCHYVPALDLDAESGFTRRVLKQGEQRSSTLE